MEVWLEAGLPIFPFAMLMCLWGVDILDLAYVQYIVYCLGDISYEQLGLALGWLGWWGVGGVVSLDLLI